MKMWLTAAEIAALGLPGLPTSKRNINEMAEREGWSQRRGLSRARTGSGGGIEYHLDLLPPQVRKAYVARFAGQAVPVEVAAAAEAEAGAVRLRDDAAEARDARLALLAAADSIKSDARLPRGHADAIFVRDYVSGRISVPDWVRASAPKLTVRTLQRWRAAAREGRTVSLAVDRGAARRGSGVLDSANDGEVRIFILALITRQPHLSADHVRAMLLGRFGPTVQVVRAGGVVETVPLPPIRTIQDALKRWRTTDRALLTAMTNPDSFKSRYRVAGSNSDRSVTRLNELWQIDASPMDALCVDGRHSVYVAIDIYSRRLVVYVSRTPRAEAVGLMLRRAILAWGVPERIKTDNGSDFTAKSIQRLIASLGIEKELSPAFTPEAKAHVERAIGTFQRDFAPLLPGFVGHSVADRKVIEARRAFSARLGDNDDAKAFQVDLTGADLQGYCDRWAADRYQHAPHAGLSGRSPFEVAASYRGAIRQIEDERALDILLAAVAGKDGVRTVGKQGLRIDGSLYLASGVFPGTQVLVRMDPADLGRAMLFDVDGSAYLGEAICPEIMGVNPMEALALAKAAQKETIAKRSAEIRREARKIKPRDMVETILGQAATKAGNLVSFPRPQEAHSTVEIEAAGAAVRSSEPAAPAPQAGNAATTRLRAEIEADCAPESNVQPLRRTETPQQRFKRALEIQARIDAGQKVEPDEVKWLGRYEAGSEFATFSDAYQDFGEAALR